MPVVAERDVFLAFRRGRPCGESTIGTRLRADSTPADSQVRSGVLLAMEGEYDVTAADMLAAFASSSRRPEAERIKALEYLVAVHHKPPPWDGRWWGTQPAAGKPPAKTIAWEGTALVLATIRGLVTRSIGRAPDDCGRGARRC